MKPEILVPFYYWYQCTIYRIVFVPSQKPYRIPDTILDRLFVQTWKVIFGRIFVPRHRFDGTLLLLKVVHFHRFDYRIVPKLKIPIYAPLDMFLAKNVSSTADTHNHRGFGPRTSPIPQKCKPPARISSCLFKACPFTRCQIDMCAATKIYPIYSVNMGCLPFTPPPGWKTCA